YASLTAMLTYLASEDPNFITRERVDLAGLAASQPADSGNQRRRGGVPTTWPVCEKASRQTSPRLTR
ncbi:MAG TPA: peptidase M28, partial [Gemmatimonadaceae bacterium]|nr:peptidase M28 [Gemmatimonadaceae bacterium]